MYSYSLDEFVDDCYTFNDIAGKGELSSFADIVNQFKLIQEEVRETEDALDSNNPEKVLDGVVDIAVTLVGLIQILENKGWDVLGAMRETVDNNLSKYVPSDNYEVVKQSLEMYDSKGEEVGVDYNQDYEVYVIKDTNNKVKKPFGFKSNSLKKFITTDEQVIFKDWESI